MEDEEIARKVKGGLESQGLLHFLVDGTSQFFHNSEGTFIEVVLSDDSKRRQVEAMIDGMQKDRTFGEGPVEVVVRSTWEVTGTGDLAPAMSPGGGLRAAVLVPVFLRSGSKTCQVTVAITKLAEMELEEITRRKPNLKELARVYVESFLKLGGRGFWDPNRDDYLEINASTAVQLSRHLKRIA